MPSVQESNGNMGGGMPPWLVPGAIGAAGGAAGFSFYENVKKTQGRANAALGIAGGHAAVALLGGQQAANFANTALTSANALTGGATYATDSVGIRSSIQSLAQAVQNLSVPSYLGLTTPIQPSTSSLVAAPAAPSNYTGLLVVAFAAYMALKD